MPSAIVALTFAAALGAALASGALFVFSAFVMPGLGRLSADRAAEAMNSINVTAVTPVFMTALFGSAVLALGLAVAALPQLGEPWAPYLIGAALLYLLGPIGLTMSYHVPRNNRLAAEGASYWPTYLYEWTRWNSVRSAAGLGACGLQIAALYVG
jgi:uncharacterized membrane protein